MSLIRGIDLASFFVLAFRLRKSTQILGVPFFFTAIVTGVLSKTTTCETNGGAMDSRVR